MKKMMKPVTLGIVAALITSPVMASLEFASEEEAKAYYAENARKFRLRQEAMRQGKSNDAALREAIRLTSPEYLSMEEAIGEIKDLAHKAGISHERLVKASEGVIREALSVFEKDEKARKAYPTAGFEVVAFLTLLESVPDYDITPIVRECLLSKSEGLRYNAVTIYIKLKETESIPFLRELMGKANLTDEHRLNVYRQIERTSENLKGKNKTADAEKLDVSLKEMRQAEQSQEAGGN